MSVHKVPESPEEYSFVKQKQQLLVPESPFNKNNNDNMIGLVQVKTNVSKVPESPFEYVLNRGPVPESPYYSANDIVPETPITIDEGKVPETPIWGRPIIEDENLLTPLSSVSIPADTLRNWSNFLNQMEQGTESYQSDDFDLNSEIDHEEIPIVHEETNHFSMENLDMSPKANEEQLILSPAAISTTISEEKKEDSEMEFVGRSEKPEKIPSVVITGAESEMECVGRSEKPEKIPSVVITGADSENDEIHLFFQLQISNDYEQNNFSELWQPNHQYTKCSCCSSRNCHQCTCCSSHYFKVVAERIGEIKKGTSSVDCRQHMLGPISENDEVKYLVDDEKASVNITVQTTREAKEFPLVIKGLSENNFYSVTVYFMSREKEKFTEGNILSQSESMCILCGTVSCVMEGTRILVLEAPNNKEAHKGHSRNSLQKVWKPVESLKINDTVFQDMKSLKIARITKIIETIHPLDERTLPVIIPKYSMFGNDHDLLLSPLHAVLEPHGVFREARYIIGSRQLDSNEYVRRTGKSTIRYFNLELNNGRHGPFGKTFVAESVILESYGKREPLGPLGVPINGKEFKK